MRKAVAVSLAFFGILSAGTAGISAASDAEVLPKGVWTVAVENLFYLPIKQQYGNDGKVEDAAHDFNTKLDASLFPDLALLQPVLDLVDPNSGPANVGTSEVTFEYKIDTIKMTVGYGVTDRLTVGVQVPYMWQRNQVTASNNTTNANVGINPFYQQGVLPPELDSAPLIPTALGGQTLATGDVQKILGPGLDINGDGVVDIKGYGYKPIKTWSDQGIGDIDLGLKYQYYKSENWRLAFTGGVRMPTGKVDDPDNLVDRAFGTGAWALLFHFNNDYRGIKDLVIDATFNYDMYLPTNQTLRILSDPNIPISDNTANVRVDLGDVIEFELSAKYFFLKDFSCSALYKYGYAFKNSVKGPQGYIAAMEDQTNYMEQLVIVGVGYSTVRQFVEKKFFLPMDVSLSYRNRFAGENILKSEYISLALQFYF